MRPKNIIQLFITAMAVAGALLVLQSSQLVSKDSPCKESLDASCEKKTNSDKMIWENLSQQFFSTF